MIVEKRGKSGRAPVRVLALALGLGLVLAPAAPPAWAAPPLLAYQVVADGIPAPLTDEPAQPGRGRAVAVDPNLGNCLICHGMPDNQRGGTVGPPLDGVGSRLSAAQIRLRIVDPKRVNAATVMPAYYRVEGLYRVASRHAGRPVLGAQQIEDLVAFLQTLR